MPSFADQLARLRVATATSHLPVDLGRWAVAQLAEFAPEVERAHLRNALLREAAARLAPEGSTWARARLLRAELVALPRRRRRGPVAALLVEVLDIDPACPRSVRQLLRILGSDTEGGGDVTTGGETLEP